MLLQPERLLCTAICKVRTKAGIAGLREYQGLRISGKYGGLGKCDDSMPEYEEAAASADQADSEAMRHHDSMAEMSLPASVLYDADIVTC